MKRYYMLAAVMVVGLLVAGSVRAEDDDDARDRGNDEKMQRMHMESRLMDIRERQASIALRNEMQKLDVELKRIEVEKQRNMLKGSMMSPGGCPVIQAQRRMEIEKPQAMRNGPEPMRGGCPGCQARQAAQSPQPPQAPQAPAFRNQQGWNHQSHGKMAHCLMFMIVCGLIHILMAVWVYQDIRKRNTSSGIWVIVALLTGLFGTLVYAVVRLGDIKQA